MLLKGLPSFQHVINIKVNTEVSNRLCHTLRSVLSLLTHVSPALSAAGPSGGNGLPQPQVGQVAVTLVWGEGSGDRQSQTSPPQGHCDVGMRWLLWRAWLSDLSRTRGFRRFLGQAAARGWT